MKLVSILIICIFMFMTINELYFKPMIKRKATELDKRIKEAKEKDRDLLIKELTNNKRTFNHEEFGHTQKIDITEFKKDSIRY